MFTIDGITYNVFCDIERQVEIKGSDLSGMLLNKQNYKDVLGSYIQYTISMAIPVTEMAAYAELYEKLTDPVATHQITMPYNNTTITFDGTIETVSDRYFNKSNDISKGVWRGTQFTAIGATPIKLPV